MAALIRGVIWICTKIKNFFTWAASRIAAYLLSWYGVASSSFLTLVSWVFYKWSDVVNVLCTIIDRCTSLLADIDFTTGVPALDGFMCCLGVDTLIVGLSAFVAFAITVLSVIAVGVLFTAIGFAVQLVIVKIGINAAKSLTK